MRNWANSHPFLEITVVAVAQAGIMGMGIDGVVRDGNALMLHKYWYTISTNG